MGSVKQEKRLRKQPPVKRNKTAIVISILLATIGVISAVYLYQYTHTAKLEKQYYKVQSELDNKNSQLESTVQDKANLQKQVEELNKTKQDLEAQLQAKLAEKQRLAALAQQQAQASSMKPTTTYSLPANQAKAFIYQKESGNNPAAVNSIGCRGLGQACPGSKLPCSNSDYACQDAWFTNYAMQRYGSWEKAYQFWIANNWW